MMNTFTTLMLAGLTLAGMAACQTVESQRINLATYAPVVDVEGQGHDLATYHGDLDDCRYLGMKVQATYEEQRRKEQAQAAQSAAIGALVGAVAGHAIGQHNDRHSGRSATAGALYGGAVGAAVGAEGVDYTRTMAKFGPTAVVDRCMTDRGYKILSAEGFGGG